MAGFGDVVCAGWGCAVLDSTVKCTLGTAAVHAVVGLEVFSVLVDLALRATRRRLGHNVRLEKNRQTDH